MQGDNATRLSPSFGLPDDGYPKRLQFSTWVDGMGGYDLISPALALNTSNAWLHFVVSSSSSGDRTLYIDGCVVAVGTNHPFGQLCPEFYVGGMRAYGGQGYFHGQIDDIRIYNRALASNEVVQLYHYDDVDSDLDGLPDWWEEQYFGDLDEDGSGDSDGDGATDLEEYQAGTDPTYAENLTDGLVAYYPFNGNANDESGYGNHGTVTGAVLTTDRFGASNLA